jgi:hypothetical protein
MADNGVTIVPPSDDLTAGLEAIGATMLENWKANASDSAMAILDAYQK